MVVAKPKLAIDDDEVNQLTTPHTRGSTERTQDG